MPPDIDSLSLVSASPRRAQLLREHGYTCTVLHPSFDDGSLAPPHNLAIEQWTIDLATRKAQSLSPEHPRPGELLIAADTMVVKDHHIIGKPTGAADARRIISLLSSCDHEVITGVALVWTGGMRTFVDTSGVSVCTIPEDEITRYVNSGNWQGKAGAYNLSERIDAGWPIRFTGDPTTIMGLPMQRLCAILDELGIPSARVSA